MSVVTSIGAGDSENQAPFFFKMLMYTVMKVSGPCASQRARESASALPALRASCALRALRARVRECANASISHRPHDSYLTLT